MRTQTKSQLLCPVCRAKCNVTKSDFKNSQHIECEQCGPYDIDLPSIDLLQIELSHNEKMRFLASNRIRWMTDKQTFAIDFNIALRILNGSRNIKLSRYSQYRIIYWINSQVNRTYEANLLGWSSISGIKSIEKLEGTLTKLKDRGFIIVEQYNKHLQISLTENGRLFIENERNKIERKSVKPNDNFTPFYLEGITIENFKCFNEKQKLSFLNEEGNISRWTVILGDNGVGKTSLLQLICGLFPIEHDWPDTSSNYETIFEKSEWISRFEEGIRNKNDRFSASLRLSLGENLEARPADIAEFGAFKYNFDLLFAELRAEFDSFTVRGGRKSVSYTSANTDTLGKLPMVAAYGAGRRTSNLKNTSSKVEFNSIASLFNQDAALRDPAVWLLRTDYTSRFASDIQSLSKTRLQAMKEAIISVLPMVISVTIDAPSHERRDPEVIFVTKFGRVTYEELSLGYKATLSLILDLAQSFFDFYEDSIDPLSQPAIVLIDEIDLHLHPKWQRTIMSKIECIFPRTQFIVTTHSPLIVQGASEGNIAVLIDNGTSVVIKNDVDSIRNWRADQILTSELFGLRTARPLQIENLLEERRLILRQKILSTADKQRLSKIDDELGDYPVSENISEDKTISLLNEILNKSKI